MKEHDCGYLGGLGRFTVRESDDGLGTLVFYNFQTRKEIEIRKSRDILDLKELAWWLFDRLEEGGDLYMLIKRIAE